MNDLTPQALHQFLRRFQFRGARLRRFALRNGQHESAAEIRLSIQDTQAKEKVRMRLVVDGVEEYRFQRRPSIDLRQLKLVSVGFFDDLTYLNLDAFPEDGPPKIMDFRASDCFVAGRSIRWEIVPRPESKQ